MRFIAHFMLTGVIVFLVVLYGPNSTHADSIGISVEIRESEKKDAQVLGKVKLYGASHALVIGNDAYTGTWPLLSNAVNDARLVAKTLRKKGFETTLKFNLKSRALIEAFEEFFYETGQDPNARLFVWYAGHGYSEGGEGYLVPTDAPDPVEAGAFLRKALSLRRMGEYMRGAKALHILSVFDSCFAGTVFSVGRSKPPPAITHATTRPVRQFLTSGDAGQEVSDDGMFRKQFIRALNGESRADTNRDGYLAASELGLFMVSKITNYSNGNQTPRNGKLNDPDLDQGDFVFQVASATPTQSAASPPSSSSSGPSAEIVFWESIKDSKRVSDYEAYLLQYPNGAFIHLARSRVRAFKTQQTASLPPPKPAIVLEPIEAIYVAVKNANVRAEPDASATKVTTLRKGDDLYVPGKVASKDWLAVDRNGKRLGYVYSKLLRDKEAFDAEKVEEARIKAEAAKIEATRLKREEKKKQAEEARNAALTLAALILRYRDAEISEKEYLDERRKLKAQMSARGKPVKEMQAEEARMAALTQPTTPKCPSNYLGPRGGFTWTGGCEGDTAVGKGIQTFRNGNTFEGTLVDGKRNGHGVYVWKKSGNRYEGEYLNDKRHGYGVYSKYNGRIFKGEYRNDKPNGEGIYETEFGKFWKGNFVDGCFEDFHGRWATVNTTKEKCGFD